MGEQDRAVKPPSLPARFPIACSGLGDRTRLLPEGDRPAVAETNHTPPVQVAWFHMAFDFPVESERSKGVQQCTSRQGRLPHGTEQSTHARQDVRFFVCNASKSGRL